MSKELGDAVKSLYEKDQIRKMASSVNNSLKKEVDDIGNLVVGMLKAGHTMPKNSKYFAQAIEEPRGKNFGTYTRAFEEFKKEYPQYAHILDKMLIKYSKEKVEKLKYGLKKNK